MRSSIARKVLDEMPAEKRLFNRKHADILVRINHLMELKGLNKKQLADTLGKSPSEINKWLKGEHNFTLMSLCKLEAALGEPIFEIPKEKVFKSSRGTAFTMTVYKQTRKVKSHVFQGETHESFEGEIRVNYG